jgi:hypothetical protein
MTYSKINNELLLTCAVVAMSTPQKVIIFGEYETVAL